MAEVAAQSSSIPERTEALQSSKLAQASGMRELVGPSPRKRFLDYVRGKAGARPVVSPFLPHPEVVVATLASLGLAVDQDDSVVNEIRLARALDYEPMFMTDCPGLLFPWKADANRSDENWVISSIQTNRGEWLQRVSCDVGQWGDESGFPVQTEQDHAMLVQVCAEIGEREQEIRRYFRDFRQRIGEEGVIVIGHPHVTWLAYQIGQQNLIFHYSDYPETFRRSMDAISEASLFIFHLALEEGADFTSDGTYGLEMTSLARYDRQDLPYLQRFVNWTHAQGGLFWYHNCGMTREMIRTGRFNLFQPDVLETIAPPPEGDNDLAESRRFLNPAICSKGNLSLHTLREGTVEDVTRETRALVAAVCRSKHIRSTADAVLPGTPPENLIAFVRTAQMIE
jgi:uroporphyrinogen-III decarboxylase